MRTNSMCELVLGHSHNNALAFGSPLSFMVALPGQCIARFPTLTPHPLALILLLLLLALAPSKSAVLTVLYNGLLLPVLATLNRLNFINDDEGIVEGTVVGDMKLFFTTSACQPRKSKRQTILATLTAGPAFVSSTR